MTKRDLDRKLCSFLVDGSLSKGKGLNQYQFYRYRYVQLKKRNPHVILNVERQLNHLLDDVRLLLNDY